MASAKKAEKAEGNPEEAGKEKSEEKEGKEKKPPHYWAAQLHAFGLTLAEMAPLWNALLISLGFMSLSLLFPFYDVLVLPLALLVFIAAWHSPVAGTIASFVLVLPAIAWQTPILAWLFLLVIAFMLFNVFERWYMFSAAIAILGLPFVGMQFMPELKVWTGALVVPLLALSVLKLGSKRSIFFIPLTIYMILLLSAMWGRPGEIPNGAFLAVAESSFSRSGLLYPDRPVPLLLEIPMAFGESIAGMFSWNVMKDVGTGLDLAVKGTLALFFADSGLLQLIAWTLVFYGVAWLPLFLKGGRWQQTIPALCVLALIPIHFISAFISGVEPDFIVIPAALVTVAVAAALDRLGVRITAEEELVAEERRGVFGLPGIVDLSMQKTGPSSLAEVGDYDETKKEVKESILMPLKNRELTLLYGIRPPKGILLFGPPGCGKTLLMSALARELRMPFYYVKCSELLSMWLGESLPYDEKILIRDKRGTRREAIGKIVEEKQPVQVAAFDGEGHIVFSNIKDFIKHKSSSPIYEVRTRSGRKIRVTGYHSLFTLTGGHITSIPTSQLIPKKSYIAIPKYIPQPDEPVRNIDFLRALEEEDYGLLINGPGVEESVAKAIALHGEKRCAELLGIKHVSDLRRRQRKHMGFFAKGFLNLTKATGVGFDGTRVSICGHKSSLPPVVPLDKEFATFLGLWVADGSYNKNQTVRLSISESELEQILPLCKRFGHVTVYRKRGKEGRGKGVDLYISSRPLVVLMRHVLKMEDGAKHKDLPDFALNLDNESLAALLRGYFSGDGAIHLNGRIGTIEACTVSPKLADSLLYALLRFGIVASLYPRHAQKRGHLNVSEGYRIMFSGAEDLQRFTEISFLDGEKSAKLLELAHKAKWSRSDQIPVDATLRAVLETKPIYSGKGYMGQSTVGIRILSEVDWSEEELSPMIISEKSGIFFDRVEEIKQVEDEEYVYDVSVEPCQNFVAGTGGIFAHNSEKNISNLFKNARKNQPCILFIDEIDSLAKKRELMAADDPMARVLSSMLTEMDGIKGTENVIVVGATNIPATLDPAILRPGRFDKIIYMPAPDMKGRKEILSMYLKKLPLSEDVDLDRLAKMTERYTGADLANLTIEAARQAAPAAVEAGRVVPLTMANFLTALKSLKPSVTFDMLDEYEKFRIDFERRGVAVAEEPVVEAKAVKWEDVVDLEDVKQTLKEAIEMPLLHEEELKKYKVRPAKGILMFGPPGCGKTMLVRAASHELKATFISLTPADISRRGYDQAVSLIKETFNRARENAPAVIFIDEIESIAPSRGYTTSKVVEDMVAQLLQELDGLRELKNVILVGATNRPDIIDKALLRPGRFDKIVFISPPNRKGRAEIFAHNLEGIAGAARVDYDRLAAESEGFTGADISGVCQEVKLDLVRRKIAGEAEPEVTTEALLAVLGRHTPSVTVAMLKDYLTFVKEFGERR